MIKQYDDPHYIVKLEKAIAEKYGHEAIQNPKKGWDEEKEEFSSLGNYLIRRAIELVQLVNHIHSSWWMTFI